MAIHCCQTAFRGGYECYSAALWLHATTKGTPIIRNAAWKDQLRVQANPCDKTLERLDARNGGKFGCLCWGPQAGEDKNLPHTLQGSDVAGSDGCPWAATNVGWVLLTLAGPLRKAPASDVRTSSYAEEVAYSEGR